MSLGKYKINKKNIYEITQKDFVNSYYNEIGFGISREFSADSNIRFQYFINPEKNKLYFNNKLVNNCTIFQYLKLDKLELKTNWGWSNYTESIELRQKYGYTNEEATKKIHEHFVKKAIDLNLQVPDDVLSDYPEISKHKTNKDSSEIFLSKISEQIQNKTKNNKTSVEKLANEFGLTNKNLVKELTELAIVLEAKKIVNENLDDFDKYQKIVELYENQVNLSHRTSQSILLQQYSTPAPISFLAGMYIQNKDSKSVYFEPSAGNGLLAIALPYNQTIVNEIDDIRYENLKRQPFFKITKVDATLPFVDYYKKFDGIITNPPFGTLMEEVDYDGFKIKSLEQLMALRALDTMKDNGRAAIIIGGHTKWDENGRIQAGKNRLFFNYLYSHYNVNDVILIDGHKLYSRQGTSFDVRLILIDGRKSTPSGVSPLKNELLSTIETDFYSLWDRVIGPNYSKNDNNSKTLIIPFDEYVKNLKTSGNQLKKKKILNVFDWYASQLFKVIEKHKKEVLNERFDLYDQQYRFWNDLRYQIQSCKKGDTQFNNAKKNIFRLFQYCLGNGILTIEDINSMLKVGELNDEWKLFENNNNELNQIRIAKTNAITKLKLLKLLNV